MNGPACVYCGSVNTEYDPEWRNVWECRDCKKGGVTPDSELPLELRPQCNSVGQMKLGIEPGKQSVTIKTNKVEEKLQRDIITELCRGGWTVLQTTVRFPAQVCTWCDRTHRHNPVIDPKTKGKKGYGADKGVPDLLVFKPWYPIALQGALEVKAANGVYSNDEQKTYHGQGNIVIARSVNEAVLFARRLDRAMRVLSDTVSRWELERK